MAYRTTDEPVLPDRSILVIAFAGKAFGIDRATGEVRWRNELPHAGVGEVFLAIGYGVVMVSARTAIVICLDYLTGVERWRHATKNTGRASILIEPDQIVCAKQGVVEAFSPTGQLLWQQPFRGEGIGEVALGYPGNVAQADEAH